MSSINNFATRGSSPDTIFEEDGCSIEDYTDLTAFQIRRDNLASQGFCLQYFSRQGLSNTTLTELKNKRREMKKNGFRAIQINFDNDVALYYKVD